MTLLLTPWQAPPSKPELTAEAVHLWRFPLDCPDSLEHLLNKAEIQRARRLRVPGKARVFVVARARLRQILAGYLELDPKTLCFNYGPSGKPALIGVADAPAFNLSHTGNWGVCAVAKGCDVGVDAEMLNFAVDYAKLAEHFFSGTEKRWLQESPAWRRRRLFFRIWTRKEAWLKGKGGGFSDPGQDIGSTLLAGSYTDDGTWWLRSFPVSRHCLATLAVSREFSLLQRWNG